MGDQYQYDTGDLQDYQKEYIQQILNHLHLNTDKDMANSYKYDNDLSIVSSSAGAGGSVAVVGSGMTMDANVTKPSEDYLITLASKNLLMSHTHLTMDDIQAIGDQYKVRVKRQMMDTMQQEITNKTKFTMIEDRPSHTMQFKAKVYVFTEEELKKFIRDVISS